jgi:hypothetical protein
VCLVTFKKKKKKKIYCRLLVPLLAVDLHWQEGLIGQDIRLEIPCIFFCFSSWAGENLIHFVGSSYSWYQHSNCLSVCILPLIPDMIHLFRMDEGNFIIFPHVFLHQGMIIRGKYLVNEANLLLFWHYLFLAVGYTSIFKANSSTMQFA